MTVSAKPGRATFAVHAVEPASDPLPTVKPGEALAARLGDRPEACSDHTADCIAGVHQHPLIAAVHQAWCDHRPLVLSPDMIWVVVLQGLAQHVKNHPERLRDRFVSHEGRKTPAVDRNDLHVGSPENPWPEVVAELTAAVRAEIGPGFEWLAADFSTTGPAERTAAEIAVLDALQPYFEYRVYGVCGIPSITLEGTAEDWRRLADKVEGLAGFELGWWLEHLRPIVGQFARAAAGDVDVDFWRNIYKRLDAYGGYVINGWIAKLFPYLKSGDSGTYTVRNHLLEGPFAPYPPAPPVPVGPRPDRVRRFDPGEPAAFPDDLPNGLSSAPFTLTARDGREWAMDLLGGFVAVTQDRDTGALRPKLGWAVRQQSEFHQLLLRIRRQRPGPKPTPQEFEAGLSAIRQTIHSIPGDFIAFYREFDGADLFPNPQVGAAYQLRRLNGLTAVAVRPPAGYEHHGAFTFDEAFASRPLFGWIRLADLPDGTYLALDLGGRFVEGTSVQDRKYEYRHGEIFPVIRVREGESDPLRAYRVVAWSFAEFLKLALDGGSRPYFDRPGFMDRGDAFSTPVWDGPLPGPWVISAGGV